MQKNTKSWAKVFDTVSFVFWGSAGLVALYGGIQFSLHGPSVRIFSNTFDYVLGLISLGLAFSIFSKK